jgi:hypothetical protein
MLAISRATGGAVTITDLVVIHDEENSEDRS